MRWLLNANALLSIVLGLFLLTMAKGAEPSHDNNILVLMQPAIAGPSVRPENYWKPEQVLWPSSLGPGNGGRLLSIAAGANWVGDASAFRTKNFAELEKNGYFEARKAMLGDVRTALLVGPSGAASPNALVLALNENSAEVKPYRTQDSWPKGALMVTEAMSWDEEHSFQSATTGRVLVVEYPPKADRPWTRFWLLGYGWPEPASVVSAKPIADTSLDVVMVPEMTRQPIPGLVHARSLVPLVVHPEKFRWVEVSQRSWAGANRYLELGHGSVRWALAAWIALAVLTLIWGASLVVNERTSRAAPVIISALLLTPAAVNLAGSIGRFLGPESWPVWVMLSLYALLALSALLGALRSKFVNRAHPLAPTFALGLISMCAVDPIWSLMSPVFGMRVWFVSPVAMAAVFGYLAGFVAAIHGCGTLWNWVGRAACLGVLAGAFWQGVWWSADFAACTMMPLFALLIGEGRFRWPMALACLVWPATLGQIIRGGVVWSPSGLIVKAGDQYGLNVFEHVEFLLSPSLYVFLLVAGGIALFGYRFFFHQLSVLRRMDARRSALLSASGVAAAFGLLHPIFLYASLTLATGGLSVLIFDAVQTM